MTEMTGITGSTHHASRPGGPTMGPADSQTLSILDPFLRFRNPDFVGFANSAAPIETTHAIIEIQRASSWNELSKFGFRLGAISICKLVRPGRQRDDEPTFLIMIL